MYSKIYLCFSIKYNFYTVIVVFIFLNNQNDIENFLNPGMEYEESQNLIFKNLFGNCNVSLQQLSEIKNL